MEDSRWRKMLVFFILLLQFTGALSRDLSYTVRAGDDVTLSCENVIKNSSNCGTTTWIYVKPGQTAVELVNLGQVKITRSDRLSVSTNCSLVLKEVTSEDVGSYTCRQFISGAHVHPDALVHLSLVNLTEDQNLDKVTLRCSVLTAERCRHTVKWLYIANNVDKDNKDITESSSSCSATVTFKTTHFIHPSRFNVFKCEIKTEDDKVQLFTFSSRLSDKSTTPTSVTTKLDSRHKGTNTPTVTSSHPSDKATTTTSVTTKLDKISDSRHKDLQWLYITLPLVALIIITAVVFILLKRTKANKTEENSSDGAALRSVETQSASGNQQHEVDVENGLAYASISYTKRSNNTRVKADDEGDVVLYSTVKAPSADHSSLYASIPK